jgi:hypothetical protein
VQPQLLRLARHFTLLVRPIGGTSGILEEIRAGSTRNWRPPPLRSLLAADRPLERSTAADEAAASRRGLTQRTCVVAMASVPPRIMGMGPAPATRKVLALAGLTLADRVRATLPDRSFCDCQLRHRMIRVQARP